MRQQEGGIPTAEGWATRSLDRALWQSGALGTGLWQLGVGSVTAWRTPEWRAVLIGLHLVIAMLCVAFALTGVHARREVVRGVFFGLVFASLAVDMTVTEDALSITVLCMSFFAIAAIPFLVMRPWPALAVSWSGAALVGAVAWMSDMSYQIALVIVVPTVCFSVGAVLLVRVLRRFAAYVDAEASEAVREHERYVAARSTARAAAEFSRTLHDTVINTLGAIASGGPAVADDAAVRSRCSQDLVAVESLTTTTPKESGLDTVGLGIALRIVWTGVPAAERRRLEAQLTPGQRDALHGIVRELLLNVVKHAGTDTATVDVRAGRAALVVVIADEGDGFDPEVLSPDRGLANSVRQRAAEERFHVTVSSSPAGTRVRVICQLAAAVEDVDISKPGSLAEGVEQTAAWTWSLGVAVAALVTGIVSSFIMKGAVFGLASAVVVAVLTVAAWLQRRVGRDVPLALLWAVTAGVPIGYLLGFAGAQGADGAPVFWNGIGLAPLLTILLVAVPARRYLVLAVGLLVAAAVVAESAMDPVLRGVASANVMVHLIQLATVAIFVRIIRLLSQHASATHRRTMAERADRASLEAVQAAQERWRHAGLVAAVELLGAIAQGRASAADPAVQQSAAMEEHYLRQSLALGPDLVHLGPWLVRGLAQARADGVLLHLRLGESDLPDAVTAASVGEAFLSLLASLPRGAEATLSYFGDRPGACLTLVVPARLVAMSPVAPRSGTRTAQVRVTTIESQELIEISAPLASVASA